MRRKRVVTESRKARWAREASRGQVLSVRVSGGLLEWLEQRATHERKRIRDLLVHGNRHVAPMRRKGRLPTASSVACEILLAAMASDAEASDRARGGITDETEGGLP
jgi:hypothetical protein